MKLEILDVYKDESYVPTEPVSLTEAKQWLLIDFTDDDTLLTSLITQSRHRIEDFCNISICPKTITLTAKFYPKNLDAVYPFGLSRWDAGFYGYPTNQAWSELPWGPVATIGSVTAIDGNTSTMLTLNTDYFIQGQLFKEIRLNAWTNIILAVYYTPYYCPSALKEAILAEIAFGYENRGSGLNHYRDQNVGISERAESLALPYRREWY